MARAKPESVPPVPALQPRTGARAAAPPPPNSCAKGSAPASACQSPPCLAEERPEEKPQPELLRRRLSKRSPSLCTGFAMKRQEPDSRGQARLLCSFQRCFVCGEMGAAITCGEKGCDRSFHLPCASRGECVTQFFGLYRSFCWEHRPEQALKAKPGQNSTCIVCLGPVEDKKSYHTMACPACQQAWFHRSCIQKQAIHAGVCFCCLHCRNQDRFVMEMLAMGIRISKRQPSWESGQALGPVYQRHRRCNASKCLCPGGREQAEEEGPWQVLLCSSCAAKGTHRRCLYSSNSAITWECDCCAGLGTGKRQSTRGPLCCYGQCPS
ncbi:PHD finger protein 7-like [Accipiter gentilis]|uniref:PHD finger protein 7-like n=1 Tax=Astur gentilis TaxID=8957 RepID=UPI00211066F5|nr:PHD finger protein 7-like [Accipiter gentilis]